MDYRRSFRHFANISAHRHSVLYPFLYMGLIYALSSIPGTRPYPGEPQWYQWITNTAFNLIHIPLYAILAWLWRWSLEAWSNIRRYAVPLAFCLTVVYGVFDEWHQSFVPRRDPAILDIILDACGAWFALWFYSKCNNDHD